MFFVVNGVLVSVVCTVAAVINLATVTDEQMHATCSCAGKQLYTHDNIEHPMNEYSPDS